MYVSFLLSEVRTYAMVQVKKKKERERERERERTRVLSDGVREEKCKASARPGAP
jgi:hypothetical protein